jgi:phenylacetaldehyde dehydrogenase
VDANMPFGGFKQSGFGREHGRSGVELYTELKSVCVAI